MIPDFRDCIRCEKGPHVTQDGLCSSCHWAVRAEVHDGFVDLNAYLKKWAAFRVWESEHRVAA